MACSREVNQGTRKSCLVSSNGKRRPKRHVSFPIDFLLESAARDADVEEIGLILSNYDHEEVDIDALHSSGVCALHEGALQRNSEMVEVLLRHGACVDRRDVVGWTPLHAAAAMSAVDCVNALLSARANVYARTNEGDLPLDLVDASEDEGVQCVKCLVQAMQKENANDSVRYHQSSVMCETDSRTISTTDSGIGLEFDDLSLTDEVCVDFVEQTSLHIASPFWETKSLENHFAPQRTSGDSDVTSGRCIALVTTEEEDEAELEQLMLSGMVAKLFRRSNRSSSLDGAAVAENERYRIMVADLRNNSLTVV